MSKGKKKKKKKVKKSYYSHFLNFRFFVFFFIFLYFIACLQLPLVASYFPKSFKSTFLYNLPKICDIP